MLGLAIGMIITAVALVVGVRTSSGFLVGMGKWRESFQRRVKRLENAKNQVFSSLNVDRVKITTAEDYVAGLTAFFKERSRRITH